MNDHATADLGVAITGKGWPQARLTSDYAKAIRGLVALRGTDRASPKGIEDREVLRSVPVAQQSLLGRL